MSVPSRRFPARRRGAVGGGRGRQTQSSNDTIERVVAIQKSMTRTFDNLSDDECEDTDYQNVFSRALEHYKEVSDEPIDYMLSNASPTSCIICLSAIRRPDAVWGCGQCFCVFHLNCIQAWARDRVRGYDSTLSRNLFPDQEVFWSCPKCRLDYSKHQIPTMYLCYCGKKTDPPVDPWLLPHSCGEICGRTGLCQHSCLSLCHPGNVTTFPTGPCPPCPKTASVSCFCQKGSSKMKRCGAEGWSCGRLCGRVLSCGIHTCEQPCHDGDCSPCAEVIGQPCLCGKETAERSCDSPVWSCDKPCGKSLSCGNHICQKMCHSGSCGDCPRSLPRTCPCGKTKHTLPCLDDVSPCGDSCDKVLSCGVHTCQRRCHSGDCGQCLQVTNRTCRCGKKSKSLVCSQEFLCESKCQQPRNCGNHMCKRRCCDGHCPPCEQLCNKPLACRNHKCQAPCHQGRCYPCVIMTDVTCFCGASKTSVPCGREKQTRPPKCRELCTLPSTCNHSKRKPHYCHPPPCPPCQMVCDLVLFCGHQCAVRCHSTPKIRQKTRPAGLAPWVKIADSASVPAVDPCPPCMYPMEVACKGGHEVVPKMGCSKVEEFSCGRQCGRVLSCTNHTCSRGCHVVINPSGTNLAGEDCLQCESECLKPRPPGCPHMCTLPCHPGDCPQCVVLVKVLCHCTTITLLIKCHEWSDASGDKKSQLKCCNSQCTQMLSCGHRCPLTCHSGDCADPSLCNRKVTERCPCGRLKKESRCSARQKVNCDKACQLIIEEKKQARADKEQRQREQALAAEREAQEALQRQLRPRKRKRKVRVEDEATPTTSFLQIHQTKLIVLVVLVIAMATVGVGLIVYKH